MRPNTDDYAWSFVAGEKTTPPDDRRRSSERSMSDDYYDRDGSPISYQEWLSRSMDTRVRKDVIPGTAGEIEVSTIWLGLNHQWDDELPPLIFETMIFGLFEGDNPEWRWSTEAEAIDGHERIVATLRQSEVPR